MISKNVLGILKYLQTIIEATTRIQRQNGMNFNLNIYVLSLAF